MKLGVMETITIRAKYSLEEITLYKALFQEFCDILHGPMKKFLGLTHE